MLSQSYLSTSYNGNKTEKLKVTEVCNDKVTEVGNGHASQIISSKTRIIWSIYCKINSVWQNLDRVFCLLLLTLQMLFLASDVSLSFERYAVVFYYLKTKFCDNNSHNFINLQEKREIPSIRIWIKTMHFFLYQ